MNQSSYQKISPSSEAMFKISCIVLFVLTEFLVYFAVQRRVDTQSDLGILRASAAYIMVALPAVRAWAGYLIVRRRKLRSEIGEGPFLRRQSEYFSTASLTYGVIVAVVSILN